MFCNGGFQCWCQQRFCLTLALQGFRCNFIKIASSYSTRQLVILNYRQFIVFDDHSHPLHLVAVKYNTCMIDWRNLSFLVNAYIDLANKLGLRACLDEDTPDKCGTTSNWKTSSKWVLWSIKTFNDHTTKFKVSCSLHRPFHPAGMFRFQRVGKHHWRVKEGWIGSNYGRSETTLQAAWESRLKDVKMGIVSASLNHTQLITFSRN